MVTRLIPSITLLFILLSITLLSLHAHYSAPSVGDLTIHAVAEGRVTVTIADRRKARSGSQGGPLAECVFTYKTTEKGAQAPAVEAPKVFKTESVPIAGSVDVVDVARQLEGACISSTSDYWTYEYCFGKYFKQYHGGDVYWLARQSSGAALTLQADRKSFVMAGGDICTTLSPPAPRQVKVTWACRKNAHVSRVCNKFISRLQQEGMYADICCFLFDLFGCVQTPQIVSISETSMCVYQIQIASALICRDSSFPVLADDWVPPPSSSSAPGPLDTGSEDWFVELVELESKDEQGEQILMCQAYSLEYRATSLKGLRFSEFELKINRLQGESTSHRSESSQLPREYQTPVARSVTHHQALSGRQEIDRNQKRFSFAFLSLCSLLTPFRRASRFLVDPSNLSVSYGRVALAPNSDSNYDGALSFIKVYA
jgi:hypothetical protein